MNIYIGICEDNNSDPLKMGRIKVRVFGIHTENRDSEEDQKQLKVEDLPWAVPVFPVQSPTIDGMSDFQVPKKGSIVIVAFLDKDEHQKPVYFGTIPRIAQELPDWTLGFCDPDQEHPSEDYLDESPISRLARNENVDKTIIEQKRNSVKTGVNCYGATWSEPQTHYSAEYTKNRVIETEQHILELDDTEGSERIHIYHKSGTSIEMHQDGDVVERVYKTRYTVILQDNNILVEKNKNSKIGVDKNEMVGHNINTKAGTDINRIAGRRIYQQAGSSIRLRAPMIYLN